MTSSEMLNHSVWIEKTECVVDMRTLVARNRQQFNWYWRDVGDPSRSMECAWAVMGRSRTRRSAQSITYRPGAEAIVYEPDEDGECVNMWRAADLDLPSSATAEDASPWLDHLAYLFPDPEPQAIFVNWCAWVVQNQEKKPNWGIVIGSSMQGNGKSRLLDPLRVAVGPKNARDVTAEDMSSGYSDWLANTKVMIVEEMHSFERKATMNRLKTFLASPPYRLRVNPKYGKQFDVPNILAGVFLTNHLDALGIDKNDRRFCVLWTETSPKPEEYYTTLIKWMDGGGANMVARYLLDLPLGDWHALGHAPKTAGKEAMVRAVRHGLDEWIEDGIADESAPFDDDLATLDTVMRMMPSYVSGRPGSVSRQRVANAMAKAGAATLHRVRLGDQGRHQLYSLRRHEMYRDLAPDELRDRYLRRQRGFEVRVPQEFGAFA